MRTGGHASPSQLATTSSRDGRYKEAGIPTFEIDQAISHCFPSSLIWTALSSHIPSLASTFFLTNQTIATPGMNTLICDSFLISLSYLLSQHHNQSGPGAMNSPPMCLLLGPFRRDSVPAVSSILRVSRTSFSRAL